MPVLEFPGQLPEQQKLDFGADSTIDMAARIQNEVMGELQVFHSTLGNDPNGPSIVFSHVVDMLVAQRIVNAGLRKKLGLPDETT